MELANQFLTVGEVTSYRLHRHENEYGKVLKGQCVSRWETLVLVVKQKLEFQNVIASNLILSSRVL